MNDPGSHNHMMLSLSADPIGMLVAKDPPLNLAELRFQVALWTDLNKQKRERLVSSINTVGLAATTAIAHRRNQLGVPSRKQMDLRCVPCDPRWLNEHMFDLEPQLFGIENATTYSKAVSGLRLVLRRVGLLDGNLPMPPDASPWQLLLDALVARGSLYGFGLKHFAAWCDRQGIMPVDVKIATLTAYEHYLRTRTLRRDIPGHIRHVAKAWRRASALIAEWPDCVIKAVSRRVLHVLPLTTFVESFQRDVAAYLEMRTFSARVDPFTRGGPKKPWKPSTRDGRLFSIRQAATALHLEGRPIETIKSLADLVDEAALRTILTHYWTRGLQKAVDDGLYETVAMVPAEMGKTATTGSIGGTLLGILKHHVRVSAATYNDLAQMINDVIPARSTQISDKNRARVRQFDDPKVRLDLLQLPRKLMKEAMTSKVKPSRAAKLMEDAPKSKFNLRRVAVLARTAIAVEILLNAPLRLKNLVALQFGVHLHSDGSRKGLITHLYLAAHETKNNRAYESVIDPDVAKMIATYRAKYHPLLAPSGSSFVFPSGDGNGSLCKATMYQHIVRKIAEEAGAYANPHLFRHLAARFILEEDPNAVEDTCQVLGDKSRGIVLAHYAVIEPANAARRHHERLKRARGAKLAPLAKRVKR